MTEVGETAKRSGAGEHGGGPPGPLDRERILSA
jgi:hypothetical protein